MKPNFLVIGAMKSGTTSLCHLLDQHRDVFMCRPKEPMFFCNDGNYARGWAWYESLFAEAAGAAAVGEGSAAYTIANLCPDTVPRMAKHLPEARLIYIVRHPLDRIESHWMHSRYVGHTKSSFSRTLQENGNLVDASLYWRQIGLFRRHYDDDCILVLFFEDFTADPSSALAQCFRFIGVDPDFQCPQAEQAQNVTAGREVERPLLRWCRRLPLFDRIAGGVPQPLKRPLGFLFKQQFRGRPRWNRRLRRQVVAQLADDTWQFLDFYGKDADYWDLESQ